jgi:hypothetical protein
MSEVTLAYWCPVYVIVDTERNEVTGVDCSDTETEPRSSDGLSPYVVDGPEDERKAAVEIADNADWPAWRFV